MAFETVQQSFKALYNRFTKGAWTPRSGQKRRRDEGDAGENQPQSKAESSLPVQEDVGLPKHPTPPAWPLPHELLRSHKLDLGLGAATPPAASSHASLTFSMAGRLRELAPCAHDSGSAQLNPKAPYQQSADQGALQGQAPRVPIAVKSSAEPPGHAIGSSTAATPLDPQGSSNPRFEGAVSAGQVPYQPLKSAQVQQQRQLQHQQQRKGGGLALPPPQSVMDTPLSTNGPRQPQGPASFVGHAATPRQLFSTPGATPETTQNLLGGLHLGSVRRPQPPASAAAGPMLGVGMPVGPLGVGLCYTAAAAAPPPGSALCRQVTMLQPHQPPHVQQPQPPQPHPLTLPGQRLLALLNSSFLSEELRRTAPSWQLTSEELRAMVAREEMRQAERRRRGPPAPLREDGGYVAGDAEEADSRVAAVAQEARATTERLREKLARVRQAANAAADPRVLSAASGAVAARTSLAVSHAVAGPETVAGVERKVAAHEREVQRMRREAEESTRAQVAAVKAAVEAERIRAKPAPPPPSAPVPQSQPQRAAARAASKAPQAPGPTPRAPARAGPSRPGPAPAAAAAEDDVLDLVSSEEEEERTPAAAWAQPEDRGDAEVVNDGEDEEEGGQEGSEEGEMEVQYGGEYGTYGNERHGSGNPALRLATRAERVTWRRTMDMSAPLEEILLAFRPNPSTDIKLSREKLQCMDVATWLNDEAINLYMMLLQARDTRLRQRAGGGRAVPRCHFFNSFFYNKLFQDEGAYNYSNVRRWTLPSRLKNNLQTSNGVLELDRVVIPIHKGVHWTCALVDFREQAVRYYDSLKGEDPALTRHLLKWVSDESADKLKERWDTSKWRVEFPKSIPAQTNGCDCGVFTIMFADRLGAGAPLDFSQADMGLLRIKVLRRLVDMHVEEY